MIRIHLKSGAVVELRMYKASQQGLDFVAFCQMVKAQGALANGTLFIDYTNIEAMLFVGEGAAESVTLKPGGLH